MATKVKAKSVVINYEDHVGDTLSIYWNWTAPDANNIQRQVNLTGYRCDLQVKSQKTDTVPKLYLTSAGVDGGIVLGGLENNIEITISANASANLGVGTYYYDCQMTDSEGIVNTIVEGTIKLLQDVTRI